jgi:kojibiose phosphorylase
MAATRAIIFDLDGVLVNTVDLHFRAWQFLAETHDIPFARTDMIRLRGRQRRDCLLTLFADRPLTETQITENLEIKDRYYLDLLSQNSHEELVAPGAFSLIESARALRLKIGVASPSANAVHVLQRVGLFPLIDVIADGNTVQRSKPAPDIFLWVAGALNAHPVEVIAFEDSEAGIEAARKGGMFVVGVGDQPEAQQAELVLSQLDTMPLVAILEAAHQQQLPQPSPVNRV